MNQSDLVQGLRDKDPAAVQHLSECYLPSVWRFVFVRVRRDSHLAEDIVSEAVLALIKTAAAETEIQNPGAWLRCVADRKIADHYRAVARVQHLIDGARQWSDGTDHNDAASQHELLERRAEIRLVMDELPEQQRIALEWKYIEKLSVRDIAHRLGTTEKAVESNLFRARREFRKKLNNRQRHSETSNSPVVDTGPDGESADGTSEGGNSQTAEFNTEAGNENHREQGEANSIGRRTSADTEHNAAQDIPACEKQTGSGRVPAK